MFHRSPRRVRSAPALLTLALWLALAPAARASDPDAPLPEPEGVLKMLAYASCAIGLATAFNPVSALAAVIGCSRLFLSEQPSPAGGA